MIGYTEKANNIHHKIVDVLQSLTKEKNRKAKTPGEAIHPQNWNGLHIVKGCVRQKGVTNTDRWVGKSSIATT